MGESTGFKVEKMKGRGRIVMHIGVQLQLQYTVVALLVYVFILSIFFVSKFIMFWLDVIFNIYVLM